MYIYLSLSNPRGLATATSDAFMDSFDIRVHRSKRGVYIYFCCYVKINGKDFNLINIFCAFQGSLNEQQWFSLFMRKYKDQ